MRRQFSVLVALTIILLIAPLSAAPVTAATSPADPARLARIRPTEFPTHAQVAKIYPSHKGGSRWTFSIGGPSVPSNTCLSRTEATPYPGLARMAEYDGKKTSPPSFDGTESPRISIYRYPSAKTAKKAFATIKGKHSQCLGKYAASGGSFTQRTAIAIPRLGQQRYAVRTLKYGQDYLGKWISEHDLNIWVRKGRSIVEVAFDGGDYKQRQAPAVRLTRIAARRAAK